MVFRRKWMGLVGVVFMATLLLGILMGRVLESKGLAQGDTYEDLRIFSEVLSQIQRNYVEETESEELVYGAIRGMLNTLDPHSAFMPPDIYKEVQVDTRGEFGGLGIQISIKDNRLVVIAPIEGTPAEQAGILAGDHIVKVNGEPTKDMTLLDAVNKMRGPKGTRVTLTIAREDSPEPIDFELVRAIIRIKSVRYEMLKDKIGYIRVSQFQEQTGRDLEKAIKKLKEEKMGSLILDLRNNPGGLLSSAVEVSEQFLDPNRAIVTIKSREGKEEEYSSNYRAPLTGVPMIILVNEGSASASEIVAGALQDWDAALIVGEPSFGKGSVQTIVPLSDGSGLRLTTARYYTPKGRSIQNTGIEPHILVKRTAKADVAGSAQGIREKDLEGHLEGETPPAGEERPKPRMLKELESGPKGPTAADGEGEGDAQLQKAIDLLKAWEIFKDILRPDTTEPSGADEKTSAQAEKERGS